MFSSLKSRAAVLAVAALAGSLGFVGTAGAAKSETKDVCKGSGWKTVTRADGSPFKNQGDCASYAAKGGQLGGTCLDSTIFVDARLTGPIDTIGNLTVYNSSNGTCVGFGGVSGDTAIVAAPTGEAATAKCFTLLGRGVGDHVRTGLGYTTAPDDWWQCEGIG